MRDKEPLLDSGKAKGRDETEEKEQKMVKKQDILSNVHK